jgi:alkaline phosphatase isozyme conversion protein
LCALTATNEKSEQKMNQKYKILCIFISLFLVGLACGSSAPQIETPVVTVEVPPAATAEIQATQTENAVTWNGDGAGTIAREHLATISQEIGARPCCSDQEARTVEYISDKLTGYGYQVEPQPFEFYDDDDEGELKSTNIMAVKKGASPKEIIVGVAVLLELAMRIQAVETPYTVRFIAFGAEEYGMEGSYYYAVHLSSDELKNIVGMINLDSVIAGDNMYIYSNVDVDINAKMEEKLVDEDTPGIDFIGMTLDQLDMGGEYPCECSDYQPFSEAGVPFVYIEATNWEMGEKDGYTQTHPEFGIDGDLIHTKYDTLDYFDQVFPGRVDQQLGFLVTELYDLLVNFK